MALQVVHNVYWESARGSIKITEMEDEHIENVLVLLSTKQKRLWAVSENFEDGSDEACSLVTRIEAISDWIDHFVKELAERDNNGFNIPRRPKGDHWLGALQEQNNE